MTVQELYQLAIDYVRDTPGNVISPEQALRPELAGLRLMDEPLMGVASADDAYLLHLRDTPAANIALEPPEYWLPGARAVVSFFLPFSATARESNRKAPRDVPSHEYMHARIEGQALIMALLRHCIAAIEHAGYAAMIPAVDPRFWRDETSLYTSNWSERHVAYASGLGTFSLSRCLITARGTAGRFGSLVTTLPLPPSPRPYSGLEDYCIRCGACVRNCPVGAITLEGGKVHPPCATMLKAVLTRFSPYYSCGKCQVGVPCESGIPR